MSDVPIKVPKIKSRKIFNGKAGSQNHLDVQQPSDVIHRTPSKISTISSLVDGAPHYDYSFGPSSLSNDCEIRSDYEPSAVHSTLNRSRSSADVGQIGSSKKSLSLPQRLSKQYKGFSEFKIKHFWAKKTVVKKTEIDVSSYAYSLDSDERGSIRSDQDVEFHHIKPGPLSRPNSGSDISSIVGASRPPKLAEIRKQSQQSQQSQSSGISDNLSIGKIRPNQSTLFGRLHRKSTEERKVPSRTGSLEKANSDEKPFKGLTGLNNIYDKARKKVSSKIQKFKAKRQVPTASDTQNPKTPPSPDMPAGSSLEKRGGYIKPSTFRTSRDSNEDYMPPESYLDSKSTYPKSNAFRASGDSDDFEKRGGYIESSAFRTSRDSDEDYMPPESYLDSRRTYPKSNAFRTSGDSDDSYISPETNFDDKATYLKSSAFRASKDSDNSYSSNPKSISGYHVNEEPKIFGPARRKQWNLGTQSQFSAESEERVPPKCLQEQPPLDESDEWLRRMGVGSTPKLLQSQSSSESGSQIQVSRPAPPLPKRDIRPQWAQWGESNTTVADVHRAGQSRNWSQSIDSNGSDVWIPEQFRKKGSKASSQDEDAWRAFGSKPSGNSTNFNLLQKRKSIDIFLNGDQEVFDDFDNCLENVPIIQVTEASPTNIDENKRRPSITKQEKVVGEDIPAVIGAAKNVNSLINQFEQPSSENDGVLSFDENESLAVLDGSLLWNDTEFNGQTVDEEGNVVLARPVSPSPSRLSQTLRTTILPESIPSCSYSRNGATSPIIVSRTSSSESASSTDVQTCIENTINMGLHSDIPFSFHSPSGSGRALVNNEVNANATHDSNICNGMRRYDTLEDLNRTDILGSKSSLVESDDNSFVSLETAKSKETTDSSDFKSISTTYSGQDRSPVKTTVTTQLKIPPPVMPKPRGKCPLAPPVQKMMAPPPPVPIHKSSVEVKEESSLKITQTAPPTGKRAVSQKIEPQQIMPVTSPQSTNPKTEPSIPQPVNRLRVQDGSQKAPRKSPRKVKTLSVDSETTRVRKSNEPTASPRNFGTKSLERAKPSLQETDIFYSLEQDDEVLQQVTNEPLNLQRRSTKYANGVII